MNAYDHSLSVLKGLRARLEMDAGFGVEYVRPPSGLSDALAAARAGLADGKMEPAAPERSVLPPDMADPRARRSPPVDANPAPSAATEAPARPVPRPGLPTGYVSLVPLIEAAPNPEKEAALASLRAECMECSSCELSRRRNSVVWGEGSLDADVMFIGEGPGRDEDLEGRPFVGRSGRVLTDIIEKGMAMPRNRVFIANVVKCRPPGNRDPRPDELGACSRYLTRQIEVIAPKIIVAVGGVAGCALLGLEPKTPGLRGRWHDYRGIPLRVMYHPSYLLRQRRGENDRTQADRITWQDVLAVMERLSTGSETL